MKQIIIGILCAMSVVAKASDDMPTLNKINQAILLVPYSCGGSYQSSGLFLSSYSRNINAPDLLYNGACGSHDYIEALGPGGDIGLIADLGDVPLEDVTPSKALNWQQTVDEGNFFKDTQHVVTNHTYVVLLSKSEVRALYAFKVVSQTQDGAMTIRYAVKSYSIQNTKAESAGFSWDAVNRPDKNVPACTSP
jgi:hypothetical protein